MTGSRSPYPPYPNPFLLREGTLHCFGQAAITMKHRAIILLPAFIFLAILLA